MHRTWAIVERELRRFRRSPMLIVMSMIFPVVQLVVLGYAFGGNVKHLKVGIVDQDHGVPAVKVRELAAAAGVRLICGRFEGVDERVLEARSVEEVSLGDFVLSGGEPAAIALIDACVRLLPGVVGCAETLAEESFAEGLLEYPHYTRPQLWQGRAVPEVLVSGDHQRVRAWRRTEAEQLTRERRPDLWRRYAARQKDER